MENDKSPVREQEELDRLAARLRSIRLGKGYTNYEHFCYEHGISRSQYGRYERGEDIRFSTLVRIIHAFGMTVEEFFQHNPHPHNGQQH